MFEEILIAIIQGITEFLPISSSGHIVIVEKLFSLEHSLFLAIWLHASSLLAIAVYYRKDIWSLLGDFLALLQKKEQVDGELALMLGVATIITALTSLILYQIVFPFFIFDGSVMTIVGVMLFITAGMIVIAEYTSKKTTRRKFNWLNSILVGVAQGLAVIPGLSRSGTTIAYLVGVGINRAEAVRISFLLAIPTIFGSLLFGLSDANNLSQALTFEYIVLFIIGFIVSLLSIKLMTKWVEKRWIWFVPYCLITGTFVLLFL